MTSSIRSCGTFVANVYSLGRIGARGHDRVAVLSSQPWLTGSPSFRAFRRHCTAPWPPTARTSKSLSAQSTGLSPHYRVKTAAGRRGFFARICSPKWRSCPADDGHGDAAAPRLLAQSKRRCSNCRPRQGGISPPDRLHSGAQTLMELRLEPADFAAESFSLGREHLLS